MIATQPSDRQPHRETEFYLQVEDKITEVNRDPFYFIKKLISTRFMDEIHCRSLAAGSVSKNRGLVDARSKQRYHDGSLWTDFSVFHSEMIDLCYDSGDSHDFDNVFFTQSGGSNHVVTSGEPL